MADIPQTLISRVTQGTRNKGKLGANLEFEIEVLGQEDLTKSYKVPEKPVEAGYSITDNVTAQPLQFLITVVSNAWNYADQRRALEAMADAKSLISYYSPIDRRIYQNIVIEALDIRANKDQAKGFTAGLKLKQVRVVFGQDATYSLAADAAGTTPQGSPGTIGEAETSTDSTTGKTWGSDGFLWKVRN